MSALRTRKEWTIEANKARCEIRVYLERLNWSRGTIERYLKFDLDVIEETLGFTLPQDIQELITLAVSKGLR